MRCDAAAQPRSSVAYQRTFEEVTDDGAYEGRAAHQGPNDGSTTVLADRPLAPGDLVNARVVDSVGADLIARV